MDVNRQKNETATRTSPGYGPFSQSALSFPAWATRVYQIYRIDDRNLIVPIFSGQMDRDLHRYDENAIEHSSGALVWSGELSIDKRANQAVTTLIPFEEAVPERKPRPRLASNAVAPSCSAPL